MRLDGHQGSWNNVQCHKIFWNQTLHETATLNSHIPGPNRQEQKFLKDLWNTITNPKICITTETNVITTVKEKMKRSSCQKDSTHNKLNLKLTSIIEVILHMSTIMTRRPMTDAVLLIEDKVDALHMDLHAESANAGTIQQFVATQEHPLQAGEIQTLDYIDGKHIYIHPKVQTKRLWKCLEITNPRQKIILHLSWHLGPWQHQRRLICGTNIEIITPSMITTTQCETTIELCSHLNVVIFVIANLHCLLILFLSLRNMAVRLG